MLFFCWFFFSGDNRAEPAALILAAMWLLHYLHRTFIYPFSMTLKPNSRNPLDMTLKGASYCAVNGFINGYWIGHLAVFGSDALSAPHLWLGLGIFLAGYALNKSADAAFARQRRDSGASYVIPQGWAFRQISCPNYLGEMITWLGFAIACWSLPALSFFLFTVANLGPRAIHYHRWYREQFADYPPQRKALLPFVL